MQDVTALMATWTLTGQVRCGSAPRCDCNARKLTDADFQELTRMMLDLAAENCNGRLISVLEGGYNLEGLALAAEAHVRALLGGG